MTTVSIRYSVVVLYPVSCFFCYSCILHKKGDGWRKDSLSKNWICPDCLSKIRVKKNSSTRYLFQGVENDR